MAFSFIQPDRLIRHTLKIRTFLSPPIRRALHWAKLMPKPSAKLARKSLARPRVPSKVIPTRSQTQVVTKMPPLSRRKRVAMGGLTTMIKSQSRAKIHVAVAVKPADPWQALDEPRGIAPIIPSQPLRRVRATHSLTVSVTDVYKATCRMFDNTPRGEVTNEDRAILTKLRNISFKHELIAGVMVEEQRIKNQDIEANERRTDERDAKAVVLRAEHRRKVEKDTVREKWETVQRKRVWAKYIKAALRGEKVKMNPKLQDVSRWEWYQAFWNAFQTGGVNGVVPFDSMPWPTLNTDRLRVQEYEGFILSPARPGFEKMNWYERIEFDRKYWNVENVKEKVIPFVAPEIHARIIRCAGTLCKYMDQLIDKYTTCDY
ncbi:hypothetical protein PQX77_016174 [Marasmius sp. AFHP31]|nr:hypothetical protein PQX77_016174 [Marasmius sp. AFHP31]